MEPSVLSRSRMTGKKTVNSRRIMAAVMVIVMLAALTGCVGKEDTQTRKKNKVVEIPMILTVDSSTGNKNEEEVVERFNRAYKGKYHIDVDWVMETEEERSGFCTDKLRSRSDRCKLGKSYNSIR